MDFNVKCMKILVFIAWTKTINCWPPERIPNFFAPELPILPNSNSQVGKCSENNTLQDWGYGPENGPTHWGGICNCGKKQSPIDILTPILHQANFGPITFTNYDAKCNISASDNGDTVTFVGFEECPNRPHISNGGLPSQYDLQAFHFHWGSCDFEGSEHTLDGHKYELELHLLHIKHGLSFDDAIKQPDGIAVIGIWYYLGLESHPLAPIIPTVEKIVHAANESFAIHNFQVSKLMPQNTHQFYRYTGSLTTPTCNEAVIWTVMRHSQSAIQEQLDTIRRVHLGGEDVKSQSILNRLRNLIRGTYFFRKWNGNPGANHRPVQPLNNRKIYYHQ